MKKNCILEQTSLTKRKLYQENSPEKGAAVLLVVCHCNRPHDMISIMLYHSVLLSINKTQLIRQKLWGARLDFEKIITTKTGFGSL